MGEPHRDGRALCLGRLQSRCQRALGVDFAETLCLAEQNALQVGESELQECPSEARGEAPRSASIERHDRLATIDSIEESGVEAVFAMEYGDVPRRLKDHREDLVELRHVRLAQLRDEIST